MNIEEAKALLKEKAVRFKETEYPTEKEYWRHICEFYYWQNASDTRVRALTIRCKNGKRHIELQFNDNGEEFVLTELYFGTFCFELNEFLEEGQQPEDELKKHLDPLLEGRYTVFTAADLKAGRLICDGFDPDLPTDVKLRLAERLSNANSFWGRLLGRRFAFEIYDNSGVIGGEFNSIGKFRKAAAEMRGFYGERGEE